MMTAKTFQKEILESGGYRTRRRGHRLPVWLATLLGHCGMGRIFLAGHLDARFQKDFETTHWGDFGIAVLRMMERLGAEAEFSGFERVRNLGMPVVWVSNHMSPLETYILPSALLAFSRLSVVMKRSLTKYPVFGRIVRAIHPICLDRKSAVEDLRTMMTQGCEALKAGRSVLVFPEGSRFREFDPERFNSIGVKLAQRAGVPMVPVAVYTDAMQIGGLCKDLFSIHAERKIRIVCGEPVFPDIPPREALGRARDFIAASLADCGNKQIGHP